MAFITKTHQEEALAALQDLVAIPSVLDESQAKPGQPFGPECLRALEHTLALCESLGLRTFKDPEGYYGYAEVGQGEDLFGILCHLDVVPAVGQTGWQTEPFTPVVTDETIIARGTQDDKGPTIAALYGVKALLDAKVTFNQRVRFIFGTDEENLWRCINRYNEKEEMITAGFVPDSKFPLTFAEKGLLQVYFEGPGSEQLTLQAGGSLNVVPDHAEYQGSEAAAVASELKKLGYDFQQQGEEIAVAGKSVHSKLAPQGVNAIARLAEALVNTGEFANPILEIVGKVIKEDATGESLVGLFTDEVSGPMTLNVANITITPENSRVGLDIRYPVTLEKETLVKALGEVCAEYGVTYREHDYIAPLYVPLDSELIVTLLGTYRELTGDMTEPFVNGGATFARAMNNCVAFGAMFVDTPDYLHQANEQWPLASLYQVMEIYAETIYRICCK